MRRLSARALSAAFLLAASAAHAGTVYVPLPGTSAVGGATYEVQVAIANDAAAPRTVKQFQIANDTDGVQRGSEPATVQVLAKRTLLVKPAAAFRGLLELSSGTELKYSARLVGLGSADGIGVDLPVVGSHNQITGGETISLQGLTLTATRVTDVTLVNLAKEAAQCTINLMRADGTAIGGQATVSLKALSSRAFLNAFGGLIDPAAGVADARANVSCDKGFFALALIADTASGDLAVVGPASSGASTLFAPGEEPACPAKHCFEAKGILHEATPAKPSGRQAFPTPSGTFSRIKMTLDVKPGPWFAADPDAKHLIYWFVINRNIDMPGMLYFRGPNAFTALVRHGIGLTHPQKLRIVKPFQAVPGRTYRCENDYDMGRSLYTVTITDVATGEVKARLEGVPNVRSVTLKPTDVFLIDMGFLPDVTPDEVPGFGSVWSNIRLEVYQ